MKTNVREFVHNALRALMTPIVAIFVRNGITYKEFCNFCKQVYVEVAANNYGIGGRPTNISRISIITGIDRKEVKRVQDLLGAEEEFKNIQRSQDRLSRLLSAWHQDSDFTDTSGSPLVLSVEGKKPSFSLLCKRYAGDIPHHAILKELIRTGCVETVENDRVRVLTRYFFPANTDPQSFLRAGMVINELASTLYNNLYEVQDNSKQLKRFERRASNNWIDAKYEQAFNQFLSKEGQLFLERVDEWLTAHEADSSDLSSLNQSTAQPIRLGVGLFSIVKKEPL